MTGFINYLDRQPDARLLHLQEVWEQLREGGKLPAYSVATLTEFPVAAEHASIIEVQNASKHRRYFVVKDGPAVVAAVGVDCSGTFLDAPSDTPEYQTILVSDYDGVVTSRRPRLYAEEHHLDNRVRRIAGIQLPFAKDGENVDFIVEFVYPLEE